ncbi:hypothetical protein [Streptomyces sp. MJP52]|uniref:hypothetical protein n=1 Tax=Streptomyces sp. MJP52 TaxID=2940555 RepID=UPI0024753D5B|nr:hypothetical protein [Streptomyces sp. MJP52]MDH6226801.1 DNA-binding helix-hairpin-helix protein with protein kinase domain [Streptomyces sp. MJP52]
MTAADGRDITRPALKLDVKMASGGQGDVYPAGDGLLYKEYKNPGTVNEGALAALPAFRQALSDSDRAHLDRIAAWPLCRVTDGGRPVGFLMRRAPDAFNWLTANGKSKRLDLQHVLYPEKPATKAIRRPSPEQRRTLAMACAKAVDWFHGAGMVIGDISQANILWTLTPEPSVHFIDCDGFRRVGGAAVQTQADTPEWGDPHTPSARASVDSDAYKTALAVVRILAQDPYVTPGEEVTFVPGCLNDRQESAVRRLFQQAAGPAGTRPRPAEWCDALSDRGTIQLRAKTPRQRPVVDTSVLDGVRDRKPIQLRGR